MKKGFSLLVAVTSLWLGAPRAEAYPELIRHGYTSCTACHLSPNGGGLPTAYGRSLSREILSTWGTEKETGPFYGLVDVPEPVLVGGNLRFLQTYMNNAAFESARFLTMQATAELAVNLEKWALSVSAGTNVRFYAMARPTEKTSVRVGRFPIAFGINDANHSLVTRRGVGFDQGKEPYALELAFLGESTEAFATFSLGDPFDSARRLDTAVAVRVAQVLGDTYKVGVSGYYGGTLGATRAMFGPYATLGFGPHAFLLAELDAVRAKSAAGVSTWGIAQSLRLSYEWFQGFHTYLLQELQKSNFDDPNSEDLALGGGLQWFPRPHLELMALYQKRRMKRVAPDFGDYAWLQLHYYL